MRSCRVRLSTSLKKRTPELFDDSLRFSTYRELPTALGYGCTGATSHSTSGPLLGYTGVSASSRRGTAPTKHPNALSEASNSSERMSLVMKTTREQWSSSGHSSRGPSPVPNWL
jgi:hypothetical protein